MLPTILLTLIEWLMPGDFLACPVIGPGARAYYVRGVSNRDNAKQERQLSIGGTYKERSHLTALHITCDTAQC